jgi:hypothetical protein
MINIAELKKEDVGCWVLYENSSNIKEKGRLKSWNDKFIFVVYKCDNQWDRFQDFTGCATEPKDLKFTTLEEVM